MATLTTIVRIPVLSLLTMFLSASVTCGQTPIAIPSGTAGETFSYRIHVEGGTPPFQFKIVSGALPGGLKLDGDAGVVSGTPALAARQPFSFAILVQDNSDPQQQFEQAFTLKIAPAPLRIVAGPAPMRVVPSPVERDATPGNSADRIGSRHDVASEPTAPASPPNAQQNTTLPPQQPAPPAPTPPPPDTPDDSDECGDTAKPDCRDSFTATAYLGVGIDTFAASQTRQYLNPNAASGAQERAIGGFDFGYRLFGPPNNQATASSGQYRSAFLRSPQLWIYGETVYGTRSAELDCSKPPAKDLLACTGNLTTPSNPGNQLLYIIRNASSLEGFMGLRWEFLSLQPGSTSPANLYLKAQAGFITVSGASALKDIHHLGFGAIVTKNKYSGSYLEVGWGRNDLFQSRPRGRWKVDGYLQRTIGAGVSFFGQVVVDTDLGYGADSVQSYLGFNLSLDHLFGK